MDFVDFRILSILNQNCRAAPHDMARVLRISPPAVSKRIQALTDAEIIHRFYLTVDERYFERSLRLIRFEVEHPRQMVIGTLRNIELVIKINPMVPTTYFCWLSIAEDDDLATTLNQLAAQLELDPDRIEHWTPIRPLPAMIKLDALDYRLLRVLRDDPRISISRLAEGASADYQTARRRLHRLINAEVCRFRIEFYPSRIERVIAFVLFTNLTAKSAVVKTLNQCFRLFPNRWAFSTLDDPPSVYYGTYASSVTDIDEMLQTLINEEYTTDTAFYLYLEHIVCDGLIDRLIEERIKSFDGDGTSNDSVVDDDGTG